MRRRLIFVALSLAAAMFTEMRAEVLGFDGESAASVGIYIKDLSSAFRDRKSVV